MSPGAAPQHTTRRSKHQQNGATVDETKLSPTAPSKSHRQKAEPTSEDDDRLSTDTITKAPAPSVLNDIPNDAAPVNVPLQTRIPPNAKWVLEEA